MRANDLRVALLPMQIEWGEKSVNLSTLENAMMYLHQQTDLLILPETFSTGFPSGKDKEEVRVLAERNTGETIDFIKGLAKKYNVAIAGTFIADTGGLLFNRAFFIEPSGEEYFSDKRHLFTMAGEDKVFSRGHDRMKVRFRGWNLAMVVCYDIRFPAWCRNRRNEYDALLVVANWPEVRVNAWKALLTARAIENECYVCGVDCTGVDSGGLKYDGSSEVVDFKGKNVGVVLPGSPFIYATLSHEKLDSFREKFPAWKDADDFKMQ